MADLLPTAEQQELASSLARVLASRPERASALADLGWLGIAVPEQAGGTDLPLVEQALVLREFGRGLVPLRIIGAIAGARLAALAGENELAKAIASGARNVALLARSRTDEVYLVDDEAADLAIGVTPDETMLFAVEDLRDRTPLPSFDESLGVSRTVAATPRYRIEGSRAHREILVLAAAYGAGLCEAVGAMAGGYALAREQFGQPIGAFQAVKHRCADMAIRAEAAWSQTVFAALSADRADATYQALSAFIVATSYAIDSARENIQLHGAIGITEELAAHRYLKRAHLIDMVFGPVGQAREALLACPDPQAMTA
jgi:alkylation response protein AidB-like acyl-CoA dehydrogenase